MKKAIVIGSGGAGLAALHAMRQMGFDARAFEQHGELGGVWATTRYPSLTIHSKSFNYRFHDFPPVASRGPSATRDEILAYFAAYARAKGIADHIVYHRRIERITYRPQRTSERCLVVARDLRDRRTRTSTRAMSWSARPASRTRAARTSRSSPAGDVARPRRALERAHDRDGRRHRHASPQGRRSRRRQVGARDPVVAARPLRRGSHVALHEEPVGAVVRGAVPRVGAFRRPCSGTSTTCASPRCAGGSATARR